MNIVVDLQNETSAPLPFDVKELISWIKAPLIEAKKEVELTVRLVDIEEMQALNKTYRHKDAPTNVLSFVSDIPSFVELDLPYLGDIFICPDVLLKESIQYQKDLKNHWAHITIHGVLHLLGYDHINEDDFINMKARELYLLKQFDINDPYIDWGTEFE